MAHARGGRSLGPFVAGDVVVLNFPFSDLSTSKRRPALVLAALKGDDLILCQITSQLRGDGYSVPLVDSDFVAGGLQQASRIRPQRLFTAESSIIVYRAGQVAASKLKEARDKLTSILY